MEGDAECGGGELEIGIPDELAPRVAQLKAIKLCLEFSLRRPTSGLRFVSASGEDGVVDAGSEQVFSYRWTPGAPSTSAWVPCVDAWNEFCLWKIEVTVRADMVAVASGELEETVLSGDLSEKTYHYVLNSPISPPNIGLAVGSFQIAVHPEMNELTSFCPPGLLELLRYTTAGLDKVCEYFEELLSSRFPYSSYKTVFVSGWVSEGEAGAYAGLSLFPVSLLHHQRLIDIVMAARSALAHAVAAQFFGAFLCPLNWHHAWLTQGLARYLTGLYIQKTFGNNEYLYHLHRIQAQVVEYESRWGGIRLNAPAWEPHLHFHQESPRTVSLLYAEAAARKAQLVMRLLEKRLGIQLFFQVLVKLLSLGSGAKEARGTEKALAWAAGLAVSSPAFFKTVSSLTGQELPTFVEHWINGAGHAHFDVLFLFHPHGRHHNEPVVQVQVVFNRKRNMVELEIEQKPEILGRMKYVGQVNVSVQELDGSFSHTIQIDDVSSRHELSCHSKTRRQKKRKIPIWTTEEVEMELSMSDADSPVLWVRLDPDLNLIRQINVHQPDFHWLYQLRYERDVLAQLQALEVLPRFPTAQSRAALVEVVGDSWIFYRVRVGAAAALSDVVSRHAISAPAPPPLIPYWRTHFSSLASHRIPRLNNFSNFIQYFMLLAIPSGMARQKQGEHLDEAHPGVVSFILDLIRFNDNSSNKYSDDYYRATLFQALGTAAGRHHQAQADQEGTQFQRLSEDERAIVEAVALGLNREQISPSYGGVVAIACLRALYRLMDKGLVPMAPKIFWTYAQPGIFSKIRLAALGCLVEMGASGRVREDLRGRLLDFLLGEADPGVRIGLGRLLASRALHLSREADSTFLARLRGAGGASSDSGVRSLLLDVHAAVERTAVIASTPTPAPTPSTSSQPPAHPASSSTSLEDGERNEFG